MSSDSGGTTAVCAVCSFVLYCVVWSQYVRTAVLSTECLNK